MVKYYIIFLTLLAYVGSAQQDTSMVLSEIVIESDVVKSKVEGSKQLTFNSDDIENGQNRSLAELLYNQGNTYIRSYGPGSLSTTSVRGSSASQTLLTWQGIPLQSPLLGLVDINLIPLNGFNKIEFDKGGGSTIWGSGAIAGNINLKQQSKFSQKNAFTLGTRMGSFSFGKHFLSSEINTEKISAITNLSFESAENDFPYVPALGLAATQQTNAAYDNFNIIQHLGFKANDQNILSIDFWFQNTSKQIPPLLTQTNSVAHQKDEAIRMLVGWNRIFDHLILKTKFGYFDEHQTYFDESILLESPNNFKSFFAESIIKLYLKNKGQVEIGLSNQLNVGEANLYHGDIKENRVAIYGSYMQRIKKLQYQFALRQEVVDRKFQLLSPKLEGTIKLSKRFNLHFSASRNFRYPSLNDRFWVPGGDVDLKPESGWSQEVGVSLKNEANDLQYEIDGQLFSRVISDWILWTPSENGPFWSSFNIAKVWSRGFDSQLKMKRIYNKVSITGSLSYSYVLSTNEIAVSIPKIVVGEQLIYTPIHNGGIGLNVSNDEWRISYVHNFTGASTGVNEDLDAFDIGNLHLDYRIPFGSVISTLNVSVKNIWDTNYLVVERRPMMGRNFELGLKIKF